MADSTRDMRRSVFERELKPKFGNQKLMEITHENLRSLTDAIVERGAPATAVHAREVVLQVYRWATRGHTIGMSHDGKSATKAVRASIRCPHRRVSVGSSGLSSAHPRGPRVQVHGR